MKPFHSFSSPEHGIQLNGAKTVAILEGEAEIIFKNNLLGKSVLDIGAWDGWFSFEAERRGAREVTASDWFCWGGPGWGTREVFDHVRNTTGSKVKDIECDIPDLNPGEHGLHDVVLLLGVLYHVTDMLSTINRAQALCNHELIIETATMKGDEPIARYWTKDTLNGDGSNFWTPTVNCVADMCREFGFERFESTPSPGHEDRHIIHAYRQ